MNELATGGLPGWAVFIMTVVVSVAAVEIGFRFGKERAAAIGDAVRGSSRASDGRKPLGPTMKRTSKVREASGASRRATS